MQVVSRSVTMKLFVSALLITTIGAWSPGWVVFSPYRCGRGRATCVSLASSTNTDEQLSTCQSAVQDVLRLSRELGPVGAFRTPEEQNLLLEKALALESLSEPAPARLALTGVHSLVYSAAPGGSSGKLGPFAGVVTQNFTDETFFINGVSLGPLQIELTASRQLKDDRTIAVRFHKTKVSIFGATVAEKEITGGGTWSCVFVGTIRDEDDGKRKLIRVMETPSLFVLEQTISVDE